MSARDELLNLHGPLTSDAQKRPEYRDNTETAIYGYSEGVEHALDTVWAKGYRLPRVITTVGELDALPMGSKVVSVGFEWTKNYQTSHAPGYEAEREVWFNIYDDFETSADFTLPATVLHEPAP